MTTTDSSPRGIYHELAHTPACDHFFSPAYPVRGCEWCRLSDIADHIENADARLAGQPVPNKIGARS